MAIYYWVVIACWAVYLLVWLVTAFSAKRDTGRPWWRRWLVRLVWVALIFFLSRSPMLHSVLRGMGVPLLNHNALAGMIGDGLCVAGVALAVWARMVLGRNWGMPMSHKEGTELVTAGPYGVIRHPIYAAILIAMLGTAIAVSPLWLLGFLLAGGYFLYSARQEEKRMLMLFPRAYAEYRRRTWMLLPYLW